MEKLVFCTVLVVALLTGLACRSRNDSGPHAMKDRAQTSSQTDFFVEPIDEAGLKKLIGERNGRILVLNICASRNSLIW